MLFIFLLIGAFLPVARKSFVSWTRPQLHYVYTDTYLEHSTPTLTQSNEQSRPHLHCLFDGATEVW